MLAIRFKCLAIFIGLLFIQGCTTSPTGRSQVALYSSEKMSSIGASTFSEMKEKLKISEDKKLNEFVQCVAAAIIPHVDKSAHDGDWEVILFESEQMNAFALPGGKIGVYTGILSVTENQDQLAAIMGHEVAHVIAEHSNERLSSNTLAQGGLQLTSLIFAGQEQQTQAIAQATYSVAAQYLVLMPYGRSHEKEADIIGQNLMAKAGFNPKAAIALWKNMAKASRSDTPEFFSTHPSHSTRIEKLTKNLVTTEPLFKQAKQRPSCSKS